MTKSSSETEKFSSFNELGLPEFLLQAVRSIGYETPSPIQAATIPSLLEGRDLLGQAQTGTGKTAAFALPILAQLNKNATKPQALVLTPTRELAIQVAEAFQRYASSIPDFHVLPIYGGQGIGSQLSALRRGVHVVVGTPGRVIDHLERKTLDLSAISTLVLDEADEMLRMGFIDDVETILSKAPAERQIALFSATMPTAIKRIAKNHLRNPVEVTIASKTTTAAHVRQRYWLVSGLNKLDALTRILEVEKFDAMIIFARTKNATEELAERLQARGFSATAINGDVQQQLRERTIAKLKDGSLDILVATDVAARGLDVERISHVINYDMPHDTEAYVHRIGRTGRAGRSGEAILFVTPRERHFLQAIERATRQAIENMDLPSVEAVNVKRAEKFKGQISQALNAKDLDTYRVLIAEFEREHEVAILDVAAALARMAKGDKPLFLKPGHEAAYSEPFEKESRKKNRTGAPNRKPAESRKRQDSDKETYRLEVGHQHGAKPNQIVGAIANEAGLESRSIGRIEINDTYSLVDLPKGMSVDVLQVLKSAWVAGQRLRLSRVDGAAAPREQRVFNHEVKASERGPRERSSSYGRNAKSEDSAPRERGSSYGRNTKSAESGPRERGAFGRSSKPGEGASRERGSFVGRSAKATEGASRERPRFSEDKPKRAKSTGRSFKR
jgi:ATP-dependent RNA helicase DeaD